MSEPETYTVKRTLAPPSLSAGANDPVWKDAALIELDSFRPEGSDHRPRVLVRALYDEKGLYVSYRVSDRYVRAVNTEFQSGVCKDSCVEFFVRGERDGEYLNFELNCCGTLLANYNKFDPGIKEGNPRTGKFPLTCGDAAMLEIYHSLSGVIDPEISEPVDWSLAFFIPFALFEKYFGSSGNISGQRWRANFYKCGDNTSHPHWASWRPVDELCFHLPRCFGVMEFE